MPLSMGLCSVEPYEGHTPSEYPISQAGAAWLAWEAAKLTDGSI